VNPVLAERYGSLDHPWAAASSAIDRLVSVRTLGVSLRSFGPSAFLCVLDPAFLLVPLPAWLLNVAAEQDTMESAIVGHYWWPILPWVFISAIRGAQRVRPRVLRVMSIALIAFTVVDSPLWLRGARMSWGALRTGRSVAQSLPNLPADASVVAQGNLVPHLGHRADIQVAGAELDASPADYVLLTTAGNLWPLSSDEESALLNRFAGDSSYTAMHVGQLFVFVHNNGPRH
jgi:hypothetical protein